MTKQNNIHFITNRPKSPHRKGVVLIITVAILVILTTIVYSLSSRVSIYKRRQEYIINYQSARYACDSAMKYALVRAKNLDLPLIKREDSPDFSDLFALDQEQYNEMLLTWAQQQNEKVLARAQEDGVLDDETQAQLQQSQISFTSMLAGRYGDPNDSESETLHNLIDQLKEYGGLVDANDLTVPGPYGPQWPLVLEPIEFEIGNAKVEIQFKDENAKFPLALALTLDEELTRQANDAVEIFCEWMLMYPDEIETLALQLQYITDIKEFSLEMEPITITENNPQAQTPTTSNSRSRRSRRSRRTRTNTPTQKARTRERDAIAHVSDFAKLLHSSIITTSGMEIPIPEMGERLESPMKYLGIWGINKINVNSAPRHVLEAVFAFGGDQELIAQEIITQRKTEPYENIEGLKEGTTHIQIQLKKLKII